MTRSRDVGGAKKRRQLVADVLLHIRSSTNRRAAWGAFFFIIGALLLFVWVTLDIWAQRARGILKNKNIIKTKNKNTKDISHVTRYKLHVTLNVLYAL